MNLISKKDNFIGKVRKSTRTKVASDLPLPVSKCEELANHFLGFNGWSSELIYHRLEEVSSEDEWTYCCAVRLSFRCVPGWKFNSFPQNTLQNTTKIFPMLFLKFFIFS